MSSVRRNNLIYSFLTRPERVIAAALIVGLSVLALVNYGQLKEARQELNRAAAVPVERCQAVKRLVEVEAGSAFGQLMKQAGVTDADASAIFTAAEDVYDLSLLRAGRAIELTFVRDDGSLQRLSYQIDTEEVLTVDREKGDSGGDRWIASRAPIAYDVTIRTVEGEIESSLYVAGLKQDLDERAIIALADVFQWTIDFVLDVQKGDRFKMIFEERSLDGQYVMPGAVLAAEYINAEGPHYAFYFKGSAGEEGYYDNEGDSVQRVFLRTPAEFRYISSGFTTGQRYISAFNMSTGHRAVDYAAPSGTPVRTVGDGKVVFAGWGGAYGNKVSIRHNAVYTTNYCHLSKILVRSGQQVSQGKTIGLVGSTGLSTGPHLHYEMVKNGTKINPLREVFPSTKPVPESDRPQFLTVMEDMKRQLDKE
jgi:murein DD-endopeptidase MepM/ murein hydrolase activator NlpD